MKQGLIIILFCGFFQAKGQDSNLELTGVVKDSSKTTLSAATVILLQARDSLMHSFTVTNKDGVFTFKRIKPDEYILQISYMGYATYHKKVEVNSENGIFDFGNIILSSKSQLLDAVDIYAPAIPIQIKKDTIEYNAGSFKTKPNDLVEDLLRKLPGVEVDADGTVKAQGEEVKKVLVDGKEFFGNDTRIATKNLPADAVDKVQVYNDLSEMSRFTGIDDGEREKTINLSLKEGRNKGYFGNVTAGYGTDARYNFKGNINRFRKGMQLSVIGNLNNINQQSYSNNEFLSMAGGLGGMMGGLRVIRMGGSGSGSNSSTGIATSQMGGINLNTELSQDTKLYGSYFFNHINNELLKNISRTNFLDDESFDSFQETQTKTGNYNHRLNLNLNTKLDNTQDISFRTNMSFNRGNSDKWDGSLTYDTMEQLSNSSAAINNASGDAGNVNANLIYRKRFGDLGRNFVTRLQVDMGSDDNRNFLTSETNFYGPVFNSTNLNQNQIGKSDKLDYGGQVSYTEPLGRRNYLEINYEYQNYTTDVGKEFYDVVVNDEVFNPTLSTGYNRDYYYHQGGITYMRSRENSNIRARLDVQNSKLKGQIDDNAQLSRGFFNLLPSASYRLSLSNSSNLDLRYSTNLREPSLEQLQPLVDNSDPLNIYQGNPDLKPQYSHRAGLHYSMFDSFNFINLFLNVNGTYIQNKMTNATYVDSLFRRVTQPLNVDYDYNIMAFLNFGTPLKFIRSKINLSGNSMASKSIVYVNQLENNANRYISTASLAIENIKKEHYDFRVGTRWTFNQTRYSENDELDQNFTNQNYFSELSIYLKKWTFNAELNYMLYRGDAFQDEQAIPLLHAYISRTFLKNDRGELRAYGFDLLNQNTGINRNSDLNYIQEERINALSRYFLFSFTYSLRGLAGGGRGNSIKLRQGG